MKKAHYFFIATILSLLSSCQGNSGNYINVILLEGDGYSCRNNIQSVVRGSDVSFSISLDDGYFFADCSYENYQIEQKEDGLTITLPNVLYPTRWSISVTEQYIEYDLNGGSPLKEEYSPLRIPATGAHLRGNAIIGSDYFYKEGYTQVGWNTAADLSGEWVPFGGRIPYGISTLYAHYVQNSDASLFEYEDDGTYIRLTSYSGNENDIVIPSAIDRRIVRSIASDCFKDVVANSITLPETLQIAFSSSLPEVETIYFFDDLRTIFDSSFTNFCALKNVRLNAIRKPTMSATYWDAFVDKIDYLETIKDEKKIVLFSGSSGRYGYDSEQLMEAYPDYKVMNMGTFAYINMYPQMELIRQYMKEGDILIHAPEFDALDTQFCLEKIIDSRFFYCVEADYGLLAKLDPSRFDTFFDRFPIYQSNRTSMATKGYEYAAKWYDDDGNHYSYPTYNVYGDMTLIRPNSEVNERLYQPLCDYTGDAISDEHFAALNSYYHDLESAGITVYFSHAPKNEKCLTEDSSEEEIELLNQRCKDMIEVPVISELQDYIYEGYYFYLIDNHLSDEGVDIRMSHFLEDLKPYLD